MDRLNNDTLQGPRPSHRQHSVFHPPGSLISLPLHRPPHSAHHIRIRPLPHHRHNLDANQPHIPRRQQHGWSRCDKRWSEEVSRIPFSRKRFETRVWGCELHNPISPLHPSLDTNLLIQLHLNPKLSHPPLNLPLLLPLTLLSNPQNLHHMQPIPRPLFNRLYIHQQIHPLNGDL